MDEVVYNLLLKSASGLALLGTLRYRLTSTQPVEQATGDIQTLLAQAQQQATIDLSVFQVEGSVAIPLLTGLRTVPIAGIALVSFIAPLTTLVSSADPARNLFFQFHDLDSDHVAGGLVWRPGEPGELVFSALGTRLLTAP
ncbi:MAG: hypothetical protein ABW202_12120 [Duganella sp.]